MVNNNNLAQGLDLPKRTVALVLAGGRGSRLKNLTDRRAKPAVYFGGKFRIIDFALSNCLNSGIRRIGVITQYKSHSLLQHLQRGWAFLKTEMNEFVDLLPAQQRTDDESWYRGTADAVYQNQDIIASYRADYIVVLAGDHIYKMNYALMLADHVAKGRDCTVGCIAVPRAEASAFGVMAVDADSTITEFVEKPDDPPPMPGDDSRSLASMGIYVFNARYLYKELERDMADPDSSHDFGKDIIPKAVKNGRAAAHPFDLSCVHNRTGEEPYWRDVGTIDAYWDANIDLTATDPLLNLYDTRWPIWTYQSQLPPAKFVHNQDDRRGLAIESLVSGGCIVSGRVFRTLLFSSVRVHSHAEVNWSVLLPGVQVGRHVRLTRCVIDRDCHIPDGMVIGEDAAIDAAHFHRSENGITLVTREMLQNAPMAEPTLMKTPLAVAAAAAVAAQARNGPPKLRVLHVAAEVFPVKTGGLADVLGALPQALIAQGADVRLVLPGLPAIVDAVLHQKKVCDLGAMFGAARVVLRLGQMPYSKVPVYVVDAPYLYRRGGSPYQDSRGVEWLDNAQRFALLGWVAAHLAAGEIDPEWTPDVLHAHDWHAAMACAYVANHPPTTAGTVFTVHNLAFQGLFPSNDFNLLGLPARVMASQGLEFHGQLSFAKAGLKFSRRVTTVSPTYAAEMATHEFGSGLDGVIRSRGADVSGILNGVDGAVWDPSTDPGIPHRYSADELAPKGACKAALQAELGLNVEPSAPVFGVVSRLTSQKGLDLVLAALPGLLQRGGQLALQGTGEPELEAAFRRAMVEHAGRVSVRIGCDEAFAHRLIAGVDAMLVPSRFEPCGLTQLYALRYGTVPVVRRVGGLADTVIDASDAALRDDTATGFSFNAATPAALDEALARASAAYAQPAQWRQLMLRGMAADFSWRGAAEKYLALYRGMALPAAAL